MSHSTNTVSLPIRAAVALLATALAPGAMAQVAPDPVAVQPPAQPTALFDDAPIAEAMLARISGREDQPVWQAANAQGSATVRDNSVGDNSPTGALGVSGAAFQNVSGISMVNLNTGNASSINASMSINLSIHMAPVVPTGTR